MPTNERREALRKILIDVAEKTITTQGLAHLKVRDLAREVGCAVGAIYNVFPDLDALILAVNLRTLALFEKAIAQASRRTKDGTPPKAEAAIADLIHLAVGYLDFAGAHPLRWRALFEHRMAGDRSPPDWYLKEQVRLFRYIEGPLMVLHPHMAPGERELLARTLFSATHGMVGLGLDEKLVSLPLPILKQQVEAVVRATGEGLAAKADGSAERRRTGQDSE